MAVKKFYGKVGYGVITEQSGYQKWTSKPDEHFYYGDVLKDESQLSTSSETTNDELTFGNRISIMADDYAWNNFWKIQYVEYAGQLWKVTKVTSVPPRLILILGGVYNGPT